MVYKHQIMNASGNSYIRSLDPSPADKSNNFHKSSRQKKPLRLALYSHETMGMGHMRRNMLIAQTFSRSPLEPTILLISGACQAGAFAKPRGVDFVTLPALRKSNTGQHYSRGLDISLQELASLRGQIILASLTSFQPDVFIVDKVPRGVCRELEPTLKALKKQGRTRCVLGLRDILDTPQTVQREWREEENYEAIRDYYEALWIYGDQMVYDVGKEYSFPADVAHKVRYVGYLNRRVELEDEQVYSDNPLAAHGLSDGRYALCMVGGGQDGALLAEAFAGAFADERWTSRVFPAFGRHSAMRQRPMLGD